jgi:parvulin-like peptidyl-prolyl isomerase
LLVALALGLGVLALFSPAVQGQAPAASRPAPITMTPPGATSQPATKPDEPVLAVGDRKVMRSELDSYLANSGAPAYQRDQLKDEAMTQAAFRLLSIEAVKDRPVDEDAFKKEMERVRADLALAKWFKDETTTQKLDDFLAKYPQFFDGTRVKFSQILIACPLYASTVDQKAKLQETKNLRQRISSGQLTFEEAATTYSAHDSKKAGGDMDWIEFINPSRADIDMVTAIAVFSTPKGQLAPNVIRTSKGFHLIKVTDVQPGDGKAKNWQDPKTGQIVPPPALAGLAIRSVLQNEIMQSAINMSNCAVTNYTK